MINSNFYIIKTIINLLFIKNYFDKIILFYKN